MSKKILEKFFLEPYVNMSCIQLGYDYDLYQKRRKRNIIIAIIIFVILLLVAIVLRSITILILSVIVSYFLFRLEFLKVKRREKKDIDDLVQIYPLFIQTLISLLYTNDNLIKVFLILESYNFHPYINRSIVILVNKYQLNYENQELIFAEFCSIFDISSASLLHQLLNNINRYGVNDQEIKLLEEKVEQEYDLYIQNKLNDDSKKIIQLGFLSVILFLCLLTLILLFSM